MRVGVCKEAFPGERRVTLVPAAVVPGKKAPGLILGSIVGTLLALRIQMTAMPQMVALLNGFGGGASVLVAGVELMTRPVTGAGPMSAQFLISAGAAGLIGAVTFWGSLVAFDQLQEFLLRGKAVHFPGQLSLNAALGAVSLVLIGALVADPARATAYYWTLVAVSSALGVTLTIPIGGADMPVVIAPGYGLAVSQAQHAVRDLMTLLEERGATVEFAIHPVAGPMPGHMNVLLAEADIPYDKLKEMNEVNSTFSETDVAIVIGANDVVNPVAKTDPNSPIAGMPILEVSKARTVVVIKRSLSPGFAGIPNPLFAAANMLMFFNDGKKAILELIAAIKET